MPMTILACRCAFSTAIPDSRKRPVLAALERRARIDRHVVLVDDLCALAEAREARFAEWAAAPELTIVACYPRAVRALFARAGARLSATTRLHNLRADEPAAILRALGLPESPDDTAPAAERDAPDWPAWYPVIDESRCRACGQCAAFCLFGVYTRADDGAVSVTNPRHCKNLCPACARICPDAAILFPKATESPLHGAEPPADWAPCSPEEARARGKTLYDTLAERNRARKKRLLR